MTETEVLIAGAGPVGLTLAIDLGRRGIRVRIVERNDTPRRLPKMERCNARTMEMFRRLGLADRVREASLFRDIPMDIFVVTSLTRKPLLHLRYPSITEYKGIIASRNDGSMPREPYQVISQYTLEPLFKSIAEDIPEIDVRYGSELVSFEQDQEGVTATLASRDGTQETVRAAYLVGCDGGSSTVRKRLGIQLEGKGRIRTAHQIFFRSETLFDSIPIGKGRHYYFPAGTIAVQDDLRHFMASIHHLEEGADPTETLRALVDLPVDIEVLAQSTWNLHLLVAERYSEGRVFMAGDAVHLVIPQGGLGMNTGVGDAIDLGWKLAGTLRGWGGPNLLEAFDTERRPIGRRNRDASGYATQGVAMWRAACSPAMNEDTPEGRAARETVARLASWGQRISHELHGIELGYRYADSPLICQEPGEGPDADALDYLPTTRPGARLPHVWLSDGSALHDCLGDCYSLLRLGGSDADTGDLERAMRMTGAPFTTETFPDPAVRAVYGHDLILVRPDLHVVWRGDAPPSGPSRVAAVATGNN